jgi:multidrug efflux pump subunit AcrA (membrane-fusion protein)
VTIDNRDGFLKPGMFAAASINAAKEARAGKVIAIPEEAIFLDGSERYVFIREGDGGFMVRRVSVGLASGGKIEIKEGLKEGDAVVIKGVFTLKSEFKRKMLDIHEH